MRKLGISTRRRTALRAIGRQAPVIAILAALLFTAGGCGYRWTYDDAFPPLPVDMARWDPPDSLAFPKVSPPPVEAVILDAYLYYLIHPEDEPRRIPKRRSRPPVPVVESPVDLAAESDTIAIGDWVAFSDSSYLDSTGTSVPVSEAIAEPLPPVQVDLSPRQEDTLIRRTRLDVQIARSILNMIEEEGPREGKTGEQLKAVRSFIDQSHAALDRRDYQGAANLALKARSLAEDVFEGRP